MSLLDRFVADARRRVAAGAYDLEGPALRSHGSLADALQGSGIIAELKPRSPSAGDLLSRPRRSVSTSAGGAFAGNTSAAEVNTYAAEVNTSAVDVNTSAAEGGGWHADAGAADVARSPPAQADRLEALLEAYVEGGASALSLLTDSDHFGGSMGLLRMAHAWGLPTLMKDFVVDIRQIDAAAHAGASAVLLIERILKPVQRERLVLAAHAAGLEVLLEVHDHEEAVRVADSAARLIGVNARDLDTLAMDDARQLEVIRDLTAQGRDVVALSGIRRRPDARRAFEAGARGVLVGTALMQQWDPGLALRALRRPLAKVCGVRDVPMVEAAAEAGADMVGIVVLAPRSPRDIPVGRAVQLARHAEGRGIRSVLVTSSGDAAAVVAAAREVRPSLVQWHGAPEGAAAGLHAEGIGFLPAVAVAQTPSASPAGAGSPDLPELPPGCDGFVADTLRGRPGTGESPGSDTMPMAGATGGTGQTHDWRQTRILCDMHPQRLSLVAGGLDAQNVAQALQATQAWGADASSGLEPVPGVKDPARVRAFVRAVHAA